MQPSRVHHVGLPVSDLDLSIAWYREALGLTHESTAGVPGGCCLHGRADRRAAGTARSGCSTLCLERPDRGATRRHPHTAWTVDDLDAAHARAVEAGGRSV
jgi:catechol 2,3-dioxygenase-like lactoylglutathione lyase family enzyme